MLQSNNDIYLHHMVTSLYIKVLVDHDPKIGLILELKPDRAGNVNLAAISPNQRPRHVDIHHDKIVKAHPTDIAGTHIWKPQVASEILRSHERNPPAVTYVTRPAPGSPTYRAAQSLVHIKNGGHPGVGYHEMGGRRRR